MTDHAAAPGQPIRKLSFFGSGSRPPRTITTPHKTYPVVRATGFPAGSASTDDTPADCVFRRPGCPCGVPF